MKDQKIILFIRLMRLDKPIGIFLLLWPMLIALWVAGNGKPNPTIVCIFILGAVIMRSAGCVINDLLDRRFDISVERTKNRPLAVGAVSAKEALFVFFTLIFFAFLLVMQLNILTMMMSIIALLLAAIYPLMKRYTHLAQVVLGATFGWAVPMAFTALTNQIPREARLLYAVTCCWAIVYDTEYAMADRVDDIKLGLKSTAILFGKSDRVMIALFQFCMFLLLIKCGVDLGLGKIYYSSLFLASFFSIYQQYLIKDRVAPNCFKAFLNNNFLGATVFLGLVLDYVWLNASG
ncbi:MAG TPA: 4-hydroxybenzoate octaprenyltransferase [Gammaproteobacteria bacterium]|nr:4-hydroxybenzoate octaprenyltransferase [Gammaproteobacteria bacterium]